MKKFEKGFSAIEIIIIVVVIVFIVAVGWLFLERLNDKTETNISTGDTNQSTHITSPKASQPSLPAGFVAYENKEFGFRFAYPQEWGVVNPTEAYTNSGALYAGTFDKIKDIVFGLAAKDFSPTEGYTDPSCFQIGFGTFSFAPIVPNQSNFYNKELLKTTDRQVVKSYKNGYCTGGMLSGRAKLDLSKSNGIDINYFVQKDPQYSGNQQISIDDYMKNTANLIPASFETQFIQVVKSIDRL